MIKKEYLIYYYRMQYTALQYTAYGISFAFFCENKKREFCGSCFRSREGEYRGADKRSDGIGITITMGVGC